MFADHAGDRFDAESFICLDRFVAEQIDFVEQVDLDRASVGRRFALEFLQQVDQLVASPGVHFRNVFADVGVDFDRAIGFQVLDQFGRRVGQRADLALGHVASNDVAMAEQDDGTARDDHQCDDS